MVKVVKGAEVLVFMCATLVQLVRPVFCQRLQRDS